jgi:hypothetical protein
VAFSTDGTICSWKELITKQSKYDVTSQEWIFRGQARDWPLASLLERTCKNFGARAGPSIPFMERQFIGDFKRHYSKYMPQLSPPSDDTQQWLSLMRHYGAPTRLLDFTFSFFVAAYFALEDGEGKSVLWAINKSWLTDHARQLFGRIGGEALLKAWQNREPWAFNKVFLERRPALTFVCAGNPYRLHERLAEQQALSLCPGDVTKSFEQNLRAVDGHDSRKNVVKIPIIGKNVRKEILHKLYRAGVHRAFLFPGLEGFAQSLRYKTPTYLSIRAMGKKKARFWPTQ